MTTKAQTNPAKDAPKRLPHGHEWDEDSVCKKCGFDGVRFHWWSYDGFEGMDLPIPMCRGK